MFIDEKRNIFLICFYYSNPYSHSHHCIYHTCISFPTVRSQQISPTPPHPFIYIHIYLFLPEIVPPAYRREWHFQFLGNSGTLLSWGLGTGSGHSAGLGSTSVHLHQKYPCTESVVKKKALTYTKMSTDLHFSLRFLFGCLLYYIWKQQVNCATYLESHSRSAATCKCLASPSSVFSCTLRLFLSAAHTHTHTHI